jgi:hypothetical protein
MILAALPHVCEQELAGSRHPSWMIQATYIVHALDDHPRTLRRRSGWSRPSSVYPSQFVDELAGVRACTGGGMCRDALPFMDDPPCVHAGSSQGSPEYSRRDTYSELVSTDVLGPDHAGRPCPTPMAPAANAAVDARFAL